jgi:ATP-dependent Zn protease
MSGLRFLKIIVAYLAIIALVFYLHMLMLGKESTINAMLACVMSGSTIGLCVIVGLLSCVVIYTIATGEKEQIKSTKPLAGLNEQEKITFKDVIVSDELKEDLKVIFDGISEQIRENFKTLGLTPAQGYLLHGPPGTGKTLRCSCNCR